MRRLLSSRARAGHPGVIGIVAGAPEGALPPPGRASSALGGRHRQGLRPLGPGLRSRRRGDRRAPGRASCSQGGGHPMAAGLTLAAERLDALRALPRPHGSRATSGRACRRCRTWRSTARSRSRRCSPGLARAPRRLGAVRPRQPRAALHAAGRRAASRCAGSATAISTACLQDAAGGRVRAVAFRAADRPLGAALLGGRGRAAAPRRHAQARLLAGRAAVTFRIEDAAPALSGHAAGRAACFSPAAAAKGWPASPSSRG